MILRSTKLAKGSLPLCQAGSREPRTAGSPCLEPESARDPQPSPTKPLRWPHSTGPFVKQSLQSLRRRPQTAPKSLVLHSSTVQNPPSTELPRNRAIWGFRELTTREASRHPFLQALFHHICLECSLSTELHPQAGPNSPLGYQRSATM